jgi:FtsH-binding integral membrane protein
MGRMTAWCFGTWLKLTAVFAATVAVAWWEWGTDHPMFWLVAMIAMLLDLVVLRRLAREWLFEAAYTWWGRS